MHSRCQSGNKIISNFMAITIEIALFTSDVGKLTTRVTLLTIARVMSVEAKGNAKKVTRKRFLAMPTNRCSNMWPTGWSFA